MRLLILMLSIAFGIYGLLPYKKAFNVDITKPNQLIIHQQECGCPCPVAGISKGQITITDDLASKYPELNKKQLFLEMQGFNKPYNFEIGHASLFITGRVIGADTVLCTPEDCELVPRFQVESVALVDYVAIAWTFPIWLGILFLINLLLVLPILIIIEIVIRFRKLSVNKRLRS